MNNFGIVLILLIISSSLLTLSVAGGIGFENIFSKKKKSNKKSIVEVPYKLEPKKIKKKTNTAKKIKKEKD